MDEKPRLPNLTDIAKLSRWAKVFFLSRCATRVIPLIRNQWPKLLAVDIQRLELVCTNAVASASLGREALVVADTLPDILELIRRSEELENVAGYGLSVVASAASIGKIMDAQAGTEFVASTMERMVATYVASQLNEGAVIGSVWTDFVALVDAAHVNGWTDETSIPTANVLGPLWPNGTPSGWPE